MVYPSTPPSKHRRPAGRAPSQLSQEASLTPPPSNQKPTGTWKPAFNSSQETPQDSLFFFGQQSKESPSSPWEDLGGSAHTPPPTTTRTRRPVRGNRSPASVTSRNSSASPFPFSSPAFSFSSPSAELLQDPWSKSPSMDPGPSSQRTVMPPEPLPPFQLRTPRIRLSSTDGPEPSETHQYSPSVGDDDAVRSDSGRSLPVRQAPAPVNGSHDKSLREFAELFETMNLAQDEQSTVHSVGGADVVLESIEEPTRQLEALALSRTSSPDTAEEEEPYDILDEEAPLSSPMLPEGLQEALDRGTHNAGAIVDVLKNQSDPAVQDNLKTAELLANFKPTSTNTIALLGDSGNGKSSLINALLHFPGLAKVGAFGSACTSVVTEYHQKLPCHTAPIHLEVEYLTLTKRNEVITDLLENYRKFYHPSVRAKDTSREDFEKYEEDSLQAWCTFSSAFGHHKELSEELLRATSETERKMADELIFKWSAEAKEPAGSENGLWRGTATSAEDCARQTRAFTTDRFWPFTKTIRVYIDAYILKSGIVLADLPGLRDTNLARVRTTEDYLMKCHHVLIVADIIRVITDRSVKRSFFSVLSRYVLHEWEEAGAKSMDVTIVCTKTDSIEVDAVRLDLQSPEGPGLSPDMESLDREIDSASGSRRRSQIEELNQRRNMLFIEARNTHVKERMREAYADQVRDKNLRIYCVSNSMYNENTASGNVALVRASEIPALRAYCTTITKDTRTREAKHFLNSSLPLLVNSVELWAKKRAAQLDEEQRSFMAGREQEVLNAVDKMNKKAITAAQRMGRDHQHTVNEQLIAVSERLHPRWHESASSQASPWYGYHPSQFNAWCLNNGYHRTKNRDPEDWNAKIILQMRADLTRPWDRVVSHMSNTSEDLQATITSFLDEVKDRLSSFAQDDIRETLIDHINSTGRDIRFKLDQAQSRLSANIQLVRRYSSESNLTSYILSQMKPDYRLARGESGNGREKRQHRIIRERLDDGLLFSSLTKKLHGEITQVLKTSSEEVNVIVNDVLGRLKADVEMMAAAATADTEARRASQGSCDAEEKEEEKRALKEVIAKLAEMKHEVRALGAAWKNT